MSMAVSLLHNASKPVQVKTAEHLFALLEAQKILEMHNVGKPLTMSYLLPFYRREKLEQSTWRLLELLKHLPREVQAEMALNIIQFIYQVESGAALPEQPLEVPLQSHTQ